MCNWKGIFLLLNNFWTFVKNQLSISVCTYPFWVIYSVPLIYVPIPLPVSHHFNYYSYLVRLISPMGLLFFSAFSYFNSLAFPYTFLNDLVYIYKNFARIFIGIVLKLYINLERNDFFNTFSFPFLENSIFL